MPIPWLRLLDAALSLSDVARGLQRRRLGALGDNQESAALATPTAPLEARFAGVVVAALKEAFDRDSQRVQLEREQREAERKRAERLLRLDWLRQAGEREVRRLQLMAGLAVAAWLGTVVIAAFVGLGVPARVVLGFGWALLLATVATALAAQSSVSTELARLVERPESDLARAPAGGDLAVATPWLLVAGLAACAIAVLLH